MVFQKLSSLGISELSNIYRVSDKADNRVLKVTNVEQLLGLDGSISLSGEVSENTVILSKANDVVTGSSLADVFDGAGGNDIIDGYLGDDTVLFFTSFDDAKITVDRVSGITQVEYGAVNNSEYAFTNTTLKSIEKIKFLDAQFDVELGEVYKIESSSNVLLENGDPATLTFILLTQPTADVTFNLVGSEINFSSDEIVFSTENWDTPQSITVSAVDDSEYTERVGTLSVEVQSDDPNFVFINQNTVTYDIKEDDQVDQVDFIKGLVWEDRNSNGVLDYGEEGISGLNVYIDQNGNSIYDVGETQVRTDSNGKYIFEDLTTGVYSIGISNSFGYNYTFPSETVSSAIATRSSGTIDQSEIPTSGYFQNVTAGSTSLRPNLDTLYANLDGSGQTVVVIDSGIDTDHSFFGRDAT